MYVKLFASLYQGTLRGCSDEILVFTNLLAHCDQHGIVDKHWRAISEETGLPRERVEKAILNLEAPDPESRSPEMDGCRIVRMDEHRAWGWKIVNYGKYRAIRDEDDRREQNRLAQERFRNKSKPRKPESAQEEGEVKEEGKKKRKEKKDGITLSQFLQDCALKNELAIKDTDPIFEYADDIKIPQQFLYIAWNIFVEDYNAPDKLQLDWRQHFRNYIRKGWQKAWLINSAGGFYLTTRGKQAEILLGVNG